MPGGKSTKRDTIERLWHLSARHNLRQLFPFFLPRCLLPPSQGLEKGIEKHIGADKGYQPYYPKVILEPGYLDGVIAGIRKQGLVAR